MIITTGELSEALKSKYGAGYEIVISKKNGEVSIDSWGHKTEPKPEPSTFEYLINEYRDTVVNPAKQSIVSSKKEVLKKLGLSKQELKALIALIRDGSED